MTPIGLQAAVREANTKATTPIQRLALILRAAKDEKKSNNLPDNSPLNLIANKIKEQLETQLKKFDVLEGLAQYKLFLLENLLLEQNFQIPLNQVNSTESQIAKLFLGLSNQMNAKFDEINEQIKLNSNKVAEIEKNQNMLREELKRMARV